MSKFEDIKELLSTAFDNFSDVLEIEMRSEFSVIEVQEYGRQSFIIVSICFDDNTFTINLNGNETVITDFDSTKLFSISNAKMVGFIPIDGDKGLLRFSNSRRCDFVFFDENDFCFVEFKLNATSEEERAIRKNRKESIDQLKTTISWFHLKLEKNYAGLNLEAYVCTPKFYYPRFNSSWGELAEDFLNNYGFKLFEIDYKICD
ncbi:hypothetical protein BMF77_00776 [Dolichospermum sp. UHCC 0315A]|jgi:hypothetical protein|uniref:hypothetical protein n=1 Tax=Dolichospermum sp. UHCC 0315A TaxID=1914871 RepID=UPI0011E6FC8E|nr:hypothetical protein [Dolichospermum sp. UHCC 0315A]QEI40215.1 hypothetical protein BMF77_00776 [Dolichospermum sp. UHCC 0315A]